MGWFGSKPVAYTVNSGGSAQNMKNLDNFFARMLSVNGGSEFTSELSVLNDGMHKFIVVRDKKGGSIVAYALLRQSGEDAEVEMLFSINRGAGYGQLAMSTTETVARDHGAKTLWLDAVPQAYGFYKHQGYTDTGGGHFFKKLIG